MADFNSQDIAEEKRKRQMAILKASNQMLKEAKETALSKTNDKVRKAELEEQFQRAMSENEAMAKTYLHATPEEVENSTYREVEQTYVDKYKMLLEKRGITDEEMHRKDSATVTTGKKKKTDGGIPRRQRKGAKKDLGDDYQPLENEEELMKQTMIVDDKQIEENIKKNDEYLQRRTRRQYDKMAKLEDNIKDAALEGKVAVNDVEIGDRFKVERKKEENVVIRANEKEEELKDAEVQPKKIVKKRKTDALKYDFDFGDIPSYVQYDVIPLPSDGQCYPVDSPLRCGRIPVAYLTASDENIIASPNVYRDGKLLDIILGRKILDKRINVNDIVSGDKDAIILWLRATSYGEDFPITATNPNTGKQYNVTISLSQFDYNEFNLEGDERGLFDFNTSNGDVIKFKFFTTTDEETLRKKITSQITDENKLNILRYIKYISESINRIEFDEEDKGMMKEDIDEIKEIVGTDLPEIEEDVYPNTITEQMILHTVSINGNEDREYIKNYVENMRTKDAMNYRNYFVDNKPGVDFNFNVNIPESDGGGSFATFLRLDDTVFINF